MGAERRKFPRYPERIKVHLRRAKNDYVLESEDVSREGVRVMTAERAADSKQEHEIVNLAVELPDELALIRVVGQLAWHRSTRTGIELGVHFYMIGGADKDRWDRYIERLAAEERMRTADAQRKTAEAARKTTEPPRKPPGEIIERKRGAEQEPPATKPAAPAPLPEARPFVVAVDPAFDRARRRFPRQRMLFMIRHTSAAALASYVSRDLASGRVLLTSPPGTFQQGEKVNLVLVHPNTQAEFELMGTVVEAATADGRGIAVAPELDGAQKLVLGEFVKTGRLPPEA